MSVTAFTNYEFSMKNNFRHFSNTSKSCWTDLQTSNSRSNESQLSSNSPSKRSTRRNPGVSLSNPSARNG